MAQDGAFAELSELNQALHEVDGNLQNLSHYIDIIPSARNFFFQKREVYSCHSLVLNFFFSLFTRIRDSIHLSSEERGTLLYDFEIETEEIVAELMQNEMKNETYRFRSDVMQYLSLHTSSARSVDLELSDISVLQICHVAVIVESHPRLQLSDIRTFMECIFNAGAERIVECPHAVEAVFIILDSLWGSSPQYYSEQDKIQGAKIAIHMLIQIYRNEECSTVNGNVFVSQLLEKEIHAFSSCGEAYNDARAHFFEVICMVLICDQYGNSVAEDIPMTFLLRHSRCFFSNSPKTRSAHFFKTILLSMKMKQSTASIQDSDGLNEEVQENYTILADHMKEIYLWTVSAEAHCLAESCFVCGIFEKMQDSLFKDC